jgi:hypothetical protein
MQVPPGKRFLAQYSMCSARKGAPEIGRQRSRGCQRGSHFRTTQLGTRLRAAVLCQHAQDTLPISILALLRLCLCWTTMTLLSLSGCNRSPAASVTAGRIARLRFMSRPSRYTLGQCMEAADATNFVDFANRFEGYKQVCRTGLAPKCIFFEMFLEVLSHPSLDSQDQQLTPASTGQLMLHVLTVFSLHPHPADHSLDGARGDNVLSGTRAPASILDLRVPRRWRGVYIHSLST